MQSKKLIVHTHHIGSHFTNALWPVGVILLLSYIVAGKQSYESASFYCFIFAALGAPVTFFSGIFDWKTRFSGRSTHIFDHKRIFGLSFVVLSILLVVWRFIDPSIPTPENGLRYLYVSLSVINGGFVAYLGHLGGKFI